MLYSYSMDKAQLLKERTAGLSLLSLERSQKLDLLIHLTSNLKQSLVVCGASGIGKTTLLTELKLRTYTVWPVLEITASVSLGFDSFQQQLIQFLGHHFIDYSDQELPSIFSQLENQGKKIIVIIDNAGLLAPGLINKLIQYAIRNECLRTVFSMTHDELNIRRNSDNLIDDCHFIDLPPLSENQCGTYLQNLSVKPDALVSYNAINDRLINNVYRETHGIPGKIISKLSGISVQSKSKKKSNTWGLGVVTLLAIAMVGIILFLGNKGDYLNKKKIADVSKIKSFELLEEISPVMVYPVKNVKNNEIFDLESKVDLPARVESTVANISPSIVHETSAEIEKKLQQPPEILHDKYVFVLGDEELKKEKSEQVINVAIHLKTNDTETFSVKSVNIAEVDKFSGEKEAESKVAVDNSQWVLGQVKNEYTIQLMVLSKKQAVTRFLQKNLKLKKQIKFIQTSNSEQTQYVLMYGSFKDAALASEKMKSLPTKYRQSWVRRFSDLQKKLNNTALI